MIFLKHFSANDQTLKGVSKIYILRHQKVGELAGTINELMGWQASTPLRLYEVSI
jgi:ubiquitin carboxyl-terminal hydrolase 7